jgi:hypothetical protein
VLSAVSTGSELPAAAADHYRRHPNSSAGNGSLMRTGPVALPYLDDPVRIADAAAEVSALTMPTRSPSTSASCGRSPPPSPGRCWEPPTAVPLEWKAVLHGWPGYRTPDLVRLAIESLAAGSPDGTT